MDKPIFETFNHTIQSELDVNNIQTDLMVSIRHAVSNHINKLNDQSFVMEPAIGLDTDVVVRRQVDDLILSLTLSPRISYKQVRRRGVNHIVALSQPYVSVYGVPYQACGYLAGDKKGSLIILRRTANLGLTGHDSAQESVDYAMSILSSDWPKQVREMAVNPSSLLQQSA
ncbi:hypothetical protein [Acidithiobacillus thiooxidans]|uniref:Uncharacterized protein n=1 Tax=Acidithiobacillus thiooxidans TaxID=930 RepID=A0A1C2IUS5_ACITH|nr:hypothetical protein [Acidithiobacillus thiooxidans]OCX69487.1 hypothetical protein A6M23_15270 [Acidithiobacillus thiooxidans]OCX79758.1 hypothetical protein A6P08_17520 [Acidithiobacillus thiooxidans]